MKTEAVWGCRVVTDNCSPELKASNSASSFSPWRPLHLVPTVALVSSGLGMVKLSTFTDLRYWSLFVASLRLWPQLCKWLIEHSSHYAVGHVLLPRRWLTVMDDFSFLSRVFSAVHFKKYRKTKLDEKCILMHKFCLVFFKMSIFYDVLQTPLISPSILVYKVTCRT